MFVRIRYAAHGMNAQVDHIYVLTRHADEGAEALRELGLAEGPPNTHPEQGTACRRFFFHNAYIELMSVIDSDEARSPAAAPTRLWQRWSEAGACPFGVALRPAGDHDATPPFGVIPYRPAYLPPGLEIGLGASRADLSEPQVFWLGFARRPDQASPPRHGTHAIGVRELTGVEIGGPFRTLSPELAELVSAGLIRVTNQPEYNLDLTFDHGAAHRADLRPLLPLTLRWG